MDNKKILETAIITSILRDKLEETGFRQELKKATNLYLKTLNKFCKELCDEPNAHDEFMSLYNAMSDAIDGVIEVTE